MDLNSDVLREFVKNARAAQKIDRARAQLFTRLLVTEMWKEYQGLLESLIQSRADEILRPARSVDGAMELEYAKGAMSGLIMARDLPAFLIAAMQQVEPNEEEDAA